MRLLKCVVHLMEKSIARVIDKNSDIEKDGRINTLAILFACKMEMTACAATSITSDTNNDTGINIFSFTNYDRGQMTIADMVIAMPQCNIVARTIVIPYLSTMPFIMA